MNTRHPFRAIAALAVACAIAIILPQSALGACGGKHRHGHCPAYADIDADSDGAVSSEEFYAFRAARMAQRAKEGHKMKHAQNAPSFEDLDLDGDGNLSAEEFAEHHAQCPMAKRD